MIAGYPIAGHPIASPLILGTATVSNPKGGGGEGLHAKLAREDEEILMVLAAWVQSTWKE